MNQKNLLILFALLSFCLTINAELINPSFEISSAYYNTGALDWNAFYPAYNSNNASLCASPTPSSVTPCDSILRTAVADANNGNYVMRTTFPTGSGCFSVIKSDLNISSFGVVTTLCFSAKAGNVGYVYAGVVQDNNVGCFADSGYRLSVNTSWQGLCVDFPSNWSDTRVLAFKIGYLGEQLPIDLDYIIFPTPVPVDLINYTNLTAYSGDTVTFKVKVLRTDLNQFVSDANVYLISTNFSDVMTYNSSTQNYEITHSFSSSQIGNYDFNVTAHPSDTSDFTNNSEIFSLNFVKESNFLENISNTSILSEYQFAVTEFKGTLEPITQTEDLIFLYNGLDNGGTSGTIDFNFLVYNSDLSGKRYFVYTATQNDYENGIWNFDDTLTFGSDYYTGIQKIWSDSEQRYIYSFKDSALFGNEKKYYWLKYDYPSYYWFSLHPDNQSDWDIQLLPSYDVSEAGHYKDYFSISQYNGMRNQFKSEIPDINSNTNYNKFLLAFNGSVASSSFNELIGRNFDSNNSDEVNSVSVSTIEHTFYVPVGADHPLMKGDSASFVQLMNSDYALIERGFFVKPLDLLNADHSEIEKILIEDSNGFVINEATPFRITSTLINKNDNLSFLEGKVYFSSVDPSNQVAYFRQDLNFLDVDEIYNLDWLVDGIIDLNGTAARDFIVVLRATDTENNWYEIQTTTFKLRQYPNSTADLSLNAFLSNKRVGEHLSGNINLRISSPNALRGLKFYVYRYEDGINAGYNKTLYKDQDFSCNGFECNFSFKLKDQVFDGAGVWFFSVSALLTTQLEDVNNTLTTKHYSFYVNYIEFETARIFQVIERNPDFNYMPTEQIPIVLQLRDADNANLKNRLKIKFFVSDCDQNQSGVGTCNNIQDVNYSPDSFLYDISTGYNYFFLRRVFIDQDGSLLNNLHFYRITAEIEDVKGTHDGKTRVVLTRRCANDSYTSDFVTNTLSGLNDFFDLGWDFAPDQCTLPPDKIVTVDDANELRVNIDDSVSLLPPNQECIFAVNANENGTYANGLEQDLIMGAWYSYNAQAIDKFDFYITNDYSDLSKENNDKQYIKVSVPFELVSFNDLTLMRQSLAESYGTSATTIGELVMQGVNWLFSGFGNVISDIPEGLTASGVITNFGYDCNFSHPIDPTYIQGMIFFKVKGIKTINKQDMVILHSDLNAINPSDLIEFMNYKNYSIPRENTTYEVYVSDMVKVLNGEVNDPLVIDVPIEETKYSNQGIDNNSGFASLPSKLKFYFVSDLFYNHELTSQRFVVPITITVVITGTYLDYFGGFQELIDNPAKVLIENWFIVGLLLFLILFVSVVKKNWNAGGG